MSHRAPERFNFNITLPLIIACCIAATLSLGDALGGLGDLGISPEVVAIEPLDDDGLYGVYLDVFGSDL